MNREMANSLSVYFQLLYDVNQQTVLLCKEEENEDPFRKNKRLLDVTHNILLILPVTLRNVKTDSCKKDKLSLLLENNPYPDKELKVQKRDGLFLLSKDILYLEQELADIINNHRNLLIGLKMLRNKIEHVPHIVNDVSIVCSGSSFYSGYTINEPNKETINIVVDVKDVWDLLCDINSLASKMQKDVISFSIEENLIDHPYCIRLKRFDFEEFNSVFASNLSDIPAKLMEAF